jgi:hypothetical protein
MLRQIRGLWRRLLEPVLEPLTALQSTVAQQRFLIDTVLQGQLATEMAALRAQLAPESLARYGGTIYSQADEDGILAEILRRLPTRTQTCIEIGCGDGRENNTHALLLQGYRGCWVDGDAASIAAIEKALGSLEFPRLLVLHHRLDRAQTTPVIERCTAFLQTRTPDLLSVDIDGNDFVVTLAALQSCQPAVLCVEYNARFPPPMSISMAYDADFAWSSAANEDYQGTSLQAWVNALLDYRLVACTLSGVNAFFVRREYASGFPDTPIALLYQPPRHRLIYGRPAHRPSLKWLRQELTFPSWPARGDQPPAAGRLQDPNVRA